MWRAEAGELLRVFIVGEKVVEDSEGGLEIQVHNICKKKTSAWITNFKVQQVSRNCGVRVMREQFLDYKSQEINELYFHAIKFTIHKSLLYHYC